MPDTSHNTTVPSSFPVEPFLSQGWEQEVLPRLPKGWEKQAKTLKAWSCARQLRKASDLLRGILAYMLCVRSFRQLNCWGVLSEVADLSEAA